jgi:hypothetical protein
MPTVGNPAAAMMGLVKGETFAIHSGERFLPQLRAALLHVDRRGCPATAVEADQKLHLGVNLPAVGIRLMVDAARSANVRPKGNTI